MAYLAGGYVAPYDPIKTDYALSPEGLGSPPSLSHPMGTDYLGRDVFSRVLVATRISMLVGVIAVAIALTIGLILGPISGYYGGAVDTVIMRTADVFFAFPFILFVLLLLTVLPPGFGSVFIAIGVLSWATYARLNRGSVLSVKNHGVRRGGARTGGRRPARHLPPRAAQHHGAHLRGHRHGHRRRHHHGGRAGVPWSRRPGARGLVGQDDLRQPHATSPPGSWWMLAFPSIFLVVTVFGFISFGNGLRDATDPKLKE